MSKRQLSVDDGQYLSESASEETKRRAEGEILHLILLAIPGVTHDAVVVAVIILDVPPLYAKQSPSLCSASELRNRFS